MSNDFQILLYRIRVEERLLRERLDGYERYGSAVPYRLVPYVY